VKIRGFRIELGEIEAALQEYPGVQQSVVVVHRDERREPMLVAYYVTPAALAPEKLRSFLALRLIEPALPARFVHLERLPLTANGKLDRERLPGLDVSPPPRSGHVCPPRTAIEEIIAGIWSELLAIPSPDRDAHFFELGGHSLIATRVISTLRHHFRVEVPLAALFDSPTLAGLASKVEALLASAGAPSSLPIPRAARNRELPLSFAQRRLWFIHQLDPGSCEYTSGGVLRLRGALNVSALQRSFSEIVQRHEVLRTRFRSLQGRPVQVISASGAEIPELEDLSRLEPALAEQELQRRIEREATLPFDLEAGPLLRFSLIRIAPAEHALVLAMHHIVSDAWSVGVLIRELVSYYEAFSRGLPVALPELPVQYADFAVWQHDWLQSERFELELAYFRQRLAGRPSGLLLRPDRAGAERRMRRAANHRGSLPADLARELRALGRKRGVTLFMTLLAGFQALLHRHCGESDIVLGTDVANRNRKELEPLIGFFVNLLVLRTDLTGDPTFLELLARTRDVALGAYAHQDLPFDRLVQELEPARDLKRTPLFQVLFVMQNAPEAALTLEGLQVQVDELPRRNAKFDLAVFVEDRGEELQVVWNYASESFEDDTISHLARQFERLLRGAVEAPHTRLSQLPLASEAERRQRSEAEASLEAKGRALFGSIRPKPMTLTRQDLVMVSELPEVDRRGGSSSPRVVQPGSSEVDLAEWVRHHRERVRDWLDEHGALLFRGFGQGSAAELERQASALCDSLYTEYGDLPREQLSERVYGSTPYPAEQRILFHNESSHQAHWPMKILFQCVVPPKQGGETPIADCGRVLQLLPRPLRQAFAERGLKYVRCFREGLDVSWQEFFRTRERAEVESKCRAQGVAVEWLEGGGLRTERRAPAVVSHPRTGMEVFFNQLQLHHPAYLPAEVRASLCKLYGAEGMPRQVYFGDGGAIAETDLAEVNRAYDAAAVSFPWREGDLLLLDNMRVAHARNPFVGDRKILVAMGEMH
jgi:non-ribosomal peptide synthetase component F/acyl carrier protein